MLRVKDLLIKGNPILEPVYNRGYAEGFAEGLLRGRLLARVEARGASALVIETIDAWPGDDLKSLETKIGEAIKANDWTLVVEEVQELAEATMGEIWKHPLLKPIFNEGKAEGEAEGKAKGKAEGKGMVVGEARGMLRGRLLEKAESHGAPMDASEAIKSWPGDDLEELANKVAEAINTDDWSLVTPSTGRRPR